MAAIEESTRTSTSTSIAAPQKKYTLITAEGETFIVDEAVAMQSQTLKHMIEDSCADDDIPIPNVTAPVMAKVIEYCNRQVAMEKTTTEVCEYRGDVGAPNAEAKAWNATFVDVDQDMLFDIILAANYLNIKSLLDLMCQTVADMFKGKSPEEIRELFHIVNDYTKEEEDEVRRENAWAFE